MSADGSSVGEHPPMSMQDYVEIWKQHSADHYEKTDYVMASGEGCYLKDVEGREYLDATSGYSAVNLGHHHPAIRLAVHAYLDGLLPHVVPNKVATKPMVDLLRPLTRFFGYDIAILMNSGAEGVETALKLALKRGYGGNKTIPANQAKIVTCFRCFHGRTYRAIDLSSSEKYREPFGPYVEGMANWVPFGDARALEDYLSRWGHLTAAFIVEPIQGEAGIILPPEGYLAEVKRLCKEYNVLFIADEVQTGLGRAGKKLVSEDVHPDIVIIGKSLGAGVTPMSAVLFDKSLSVFKPGEHGSTYAGNAFACTIAKAVLETIEYYNLCARSQVMGLYLKELLKDLLKGNSRIKEIRGQALMIGIEFHEDISSTMAERCFKEGVVTIGGSNNTIRVCPPLIVDHHLCNQYAERIARALNA